MTPYNAWVYIYAHGQPWGSVVEPITSLYGCTLGTLWLLRCVITTPFSIQGCCLITSWHPLGVQGCCLGTLWHLQGCCLVPQDTYEYTGVLPWHFMTPSGVLFSTSWHSIGVQGCCLGTSWHLQGCCLEPHDTPPPKIEGGYMIIMENGNMFYCITKQTCCLHMLKMLCDYSYF